MKDSLLRSRKILGDIPDEDGWYHGTDNIQWREWCLKESNYIITQTIRSNDYAGDFSRFRLIWKAK
jgi:hypothetical protein